jgi:hypothetical protein
MKILDYENMKNGIDYIKENIKAEYVNVKISTLGGVENACLMISISMDKMESWAYGIFQNSRYYQLSIDKYGTIENFSRGLNTNKIRKQNGKSLIESIEYINAKIKEV